MTHQELRALMETFCDEIDTRIGQALDDPELAKAIAAAATKAEVEALIRDRIEPLKRKIMQRAEEIANGIDRGSKAS